MTKQEDQVVVLAEAGLRQLKDMKRVLTRAGVDSAIIRPPGARNTWGTRLLLAVASEDAQNALAALRADWYANASEEERLASETVVDHNAAEITCPACGTAFPSGPSECPECGLGLV